MMQQGSWAVLGMEIEGILLRFLPSVPSIAFDQQHKPFPFPFSIFHFISLKKRKYNDNPAQPADSKANRGGLHF